MWNHAASIENVRAGAIKTAPGSNTTSIKNSTYQKIATAIVAISRRLINYRGKTRTLTTTPRCLRSLDHFWRDVFADVICGAAMPIAKNLTTCAATTGDSLCPAREIAGGASYVSFLRAIIV